MADEQLIKPRDLNPALAVYSDDAIMTDDGVTVSKATPVQIVDAGAPVASEAEAIAGTDNTKRITPLNLKQVLDDTTAPAVTRAQAWAESPDTPDPAIPGSKSSKTWAIESEASAIRSADSADLASALTAEAPQSWADFSRFDGYADGKVVWFNGVQFVRKRGADIPGLGAGPGWEPVGDVTPEHWGGGEDGLYLSAQWAIDNNLPHKAVGDFNLTKGITLYLDGHAVLNWASASLTAAVGFPGNNAKMLSVRAGDNGPQVLDLIIGKVDCANQPNSGPGQAHDALNIAPGGGELSINVEVFYMYAGEHWTTSGGDSLIMAVGDNININVHHAVGAKDVGVYVSSPGTLTRAPHRSCKVRGHFSKCSSGVMVKRGFHIVDVDISAAGCITGGGFASAEVGGVFDHGRYNETGTWRVSARECQSAYQGQMFRGITVIADAADIGCASPEYTSDEGHGIRLTSGSDALCILNVHGINPAITPSSLTTFRAVSVLQHVEAPSMHSTGNRFIINTSRLGRIVHESGADTGNNYYDITYHDMLSPEANLYTMVATSRMLSRDLIGRSTREDTSLENKWLRTGTEYVQRILGSDGSEVARIGFNSTNMDWGFRAGGTSAEFLIGQNGYVRIPRLPTYADNATAIAGGSTSGSLYKTATGEVRIVYTP